MSDEPLDMINMNDAYESFYKEIKELKRENAELKERIELIKVLIKSPPEYTKDKGDFYSYAMGHVSKYLDMSIEDLRKE